MTKIILTVLLLLATSSLLADEADELKALLDDFLTGQTEQHHDKFWADELIYTSSNGSRFGKAEIMASFDADNSDSEQAQKTRYSATDVDIRLYDDVAIVAFMLLAKEKGVVTQTYYNTGTFQKRAGRWQAIAWQATMIPDKQ
jgi:hypothetical protein